MMRVCVRKAIAGSVGVGLVLTMASCSSKSGSANGRVQGVSGKTVTIGVPVPLSGDLSANGVPVGDGVKFAADQLNKAGGIDGYKIKLKEMDTQGSPSTAAQVGLKLVTVYKVYALVGGFGSSPDTAMVQAIKRYHPLFIHAGSSSNDIAAAVGKEPWYYHVYLWDPDDALTLTNFLKTLSPRPQRIALVNEDNAFGSDNTSYAAKFLKAAKFNVVTHQTYTSGATDFSPIMSRLKAAKPDVVFFVGEGAGDNVLFTKQAIQEGVNAKLLINVAGADTRPDYGSLGNGVILETSWTADPALAYQTKFDNEWKAAHNGKYPNQGNVLGYSAMITLGDAVNHAKSLDYSKVEQALNTMTFDTPFGKVTYHKSQSTGALHELTGSKVNTMLQFGPQTSITKGQQVVYPPALASGKVVYPAPYYRG